MARKPSVRFSPILKSKEKYATDSTQLISSAEMVAIEKKRDRNNFGKKDFECLSVDVFYWEPKSFFSRLLIRSSISLYKGRKNNALISSLKV